MQSLTLYLTFIERWTSIYNYIHHYTVIHLADLSIIQMELQYTASKWKTNSMETIFPLLKAKRKQWKWTKTCKTALCSILHLDSWLWQGSLFTDRAGDAMHLVRNLIRSIHSFSEEVFTAQVLNVLQKIKTNAVGVILVKVPQIWVLCHINLLKSSPPSVKGNSDAICVAAVWMSRVIYFTLLFSHLADAFIQSDLQLRKSNKLLVQTL